MASERMPWSWWVRCDLNGRTWPVPERRHVKVQMWFVAYTQS